MRLSHGLKGGFCNFHSPGRMRSGRNCHRVTRWSRCIGGSSLSQRSSRLTGTRLPQTIDWLLLHGWLAISPRPQRPPLLGALNDQNKPKCGQTITVKPSEEFEHKFRRKKQLSVHHAVRSWEMKGQISIFTEISH